MKVDELMLQHELKAQARSNERTAESKRIEMLQNLLRKKMQQQKASTRAESISAA